MPVRFEILDPRRLFSAFADPTFGTAGVAAVPTAASPTTALDTGTAVYEAFDNRGTAGFNAYEPAKIFKLTEAGVVDATWGDNGAATLPFTPKLMAFDRRTGKLYAAGRADFDTTVEDASVPQSLALRVARLRPDGTLDSTYGSGGVVNYQPGRPQGDFTYSAAPTHLLPRLHGGLDVGIDVTETYDDADGQSFSHTVGVLRLRASGQRDSAFGRRGYTALAGEFDGWSLPVLAADSSGGLTAVTARYGAIYYSEDDSGGGIDASTYDVYRYAVDAAGRLASVPGSHWRLLKAHDDAAAHARLQNGATSVVATADRVYATAATDNTLYALTPGEAPVLSQLLPGELTNTDAGSTAGVRLQPGPRGTFYAVGEFGPARIDYGYAVARLRPNLSLDRRWGDNGMVNAGGSIGTVIDTNGRVLGLGNSTVSRSDGVNGTPAVTGVTPGTARIGDDVLRVRGTLDADRIAVKYNSSTRVVTVAINDRPVRYFFDGDFSSVLVDAEDGNDILDLAGLDAKVIVLAGGGNDKIDVRNITDDVVPIGSGLTVRGGGGNDTVRLHRSDLTALDAGPGRDSLLTDADSTAAVVLNTEVRGPLATA